MSKLVIDPSLLNDPLASDPRLLRPDIKAALAIMAVRARKERPEVATPIVPIDWAPMRAVPDDGVPTPQAQGYASPADILFFGGAAGGGKGLTNQSVAMCQYGPRSFFDLGVGDRIYAPDGSLTEIVALYHRGIQPVYRVCFSDGAEVKVDADHLWLISTAGQVQKAAIRREIRGRVLPTLRLKQTIDAQHLKSGRKYFPQIPLTQPLEFSRVIDSRHGEPRPIPPYLLGVLLGDGHITKTTRFCSADPEIVARFVEHYGADRVRRYDDLNWAIADHGHTVSMLGHLMLLGRRAETKFIPPGYLLAPIACRWEMLRGLFDTDGYVDTRGHASFVSVSLQLAKDVQWLLRSVGFKATMTDKLPSYVNEGGLRIQGQRAYTVYPTGADATPLFALTRKRLRCLPPQQPGWRRMESIEYVGEEETRCIVVDHPSGLFVTDDFIVTHNSDLLLGLAGTSHRKSIIFRREFPQMLELRERSRALFGPYGRFNGQEQVWHLDDGRTLEFGAVQHERFTSKYQGRPHDLCAFDELPTLLESQFRFLCGWMRTTTPGQRCRVVATGNPPTSAEGEWIIQYWGPWLDPQHPYPAIPGELRWYATVDGKDVERQDGTPFEHKGEMLTPMSRTFIPSRVEDNPYLMASGYKTVLQNLPEPLRSKMLHGDFSAGMEDNPWQVIPTAWVDAAMARWTEQTPDLPLSALGVDVARGGKDQTTIVKRYGPWFSRIAKYPGVQTPDGPSVSALVVMAHEGAAPIQIDIIGVGGSGYDYVKGVKPDCTIPMNGAKASNARDRSGQLHFRNKRAEWHWKLREALDPVNGDELALPPDREMRADLIAPRWKLSAQGIQIEEKDEIKVRLGRSPDSGEAIIYAHAQERTRWVPVGV